jgi:chromosome segregation ATPase
LKSKNDNVCELESQIGKLESSLATALAQVEAKTTSMEETENAKAVVEAQLQETQASLSKLEIEVRDININLYSMQKELEEAKIAAKAQDTQVGTLKARIQELEAALSSSQDIIKALEKGHAADAASAAEIASVKHKKLLEAQAALKAISEDAAGLKTAHKQALEDSTTQAKALEEKAAESDELNAQVTSLKSEKEDHANKLSELEIEILELKETQEGLEDTRDGLQRQITTLENDLAKAAVAAALAAEVASGKEEEHLAQFKQQVQQHEQELVIQSKRYDEIAASLKALEEQHADISKAYEQAKQDISSIERAHALKLTEIEQAHSTQRDAQSAEFAKSKAELENQETIYNSKVDAVKAEHVQLLQDAFERAKRDAGDVHAQELQSLRATSNATVEQIQAANQVALEVLKADHQSALENESNSLNKLINKLTLELKATQDDFSKTKTTLEGSKSEIDRLTEQRDEARALVDARPTLSPEHAEEIARLTHELANSKDDFAAVTDALNLTKSSISEMSDKHARELEEGAKTRADEIIKLKSVHDSEVAALQAQNSEAMIKLVDLEGELATVKATLAAQQQSIVPESANESQPQEQTVTKEELSKLHEAHNLKIYDLQAEHEKALNVLREAVEVTKFRVGELEQELGRKVMEIQYMDQEQEENQETISRLSEDIETLTEMLKQGSE